MAQNSLDVIGFAISNLIGNLLTMFTLDNQKSSNLTGVNTCIAALTQRYMAVFSKKQGTLCSMQERLTLKEGATPKFVKALSLPYALRPKVEAEPERQETAGIITPVTWSEWATPIVPIVKQGGSIRICGDFKVTVNAQLKVDLYLLPQIGDIFASLSSG